MSHGDFAHGSCLENSVSSLRKANVVLLLKQHRLVFH
jgi:hypothetical protein